MLGAKRTALADMVKLFPNRQCKEQCKEPFRGETIQVPKTWKRCTGATQASGAGEPEQDQPDSETTEASHGISNLALNILDMVPLNSINLPPPFLWIYHDFHLLPSASKVH